MAHLLTSLFTCTSAQNDLSMLGQYSITIEHVQPEKGNYRQLVWQWQWQWKWLFLKETFFTPEEQEVRKSNARADRKFLLEVAFFHWRKHKNFSPIGFLKKMEIANSPLGMGAKRYSDFEKCFCCAPISWSMSLSVGQWISLSVGISINQFVSQFGCLSASLSDSLLVDLSFLWCVCH